MSRRASSAAVPRLRVTGAVAARQHRWRARRWGLRAAWHRSVRRRPHPPGCSALARRPRRNPPNTEFRRFYERGDLPCKIDPRAAKRRLLWHVPLEKLDLAHFLPLLLDGLREVRRAGRPSRRQPAPSWRPSVHPPLVPSPCPLPRRRSTRTASWRSRGRGS